MSERPGLSHRLEHLGYRIAAATLGNLSLDTGTSIAAGLARVIGMRSGLRRRAARNLLQAMPDLTAARQREILVGMFDNLARTSVEYRHLPRLIREEERIEVVGAEHLEAVREAGRGAMLATGHFGNWEAIRIAFARHDYPPALIYRRFNNRAFDADARRLMAAVDAPIFHKGRRGTLQLLRHVRDGGGVLILTDQRFSGAPELPFFGKPAQTSLGTAEIALNYGAAILPVRGERIGSKSRFRVTIEAPVPVEGRSAGEIMTDLNARLESWIEARPEQYFWLHDRWGKPEARKRAD